MSVCDTLRRNKFTFSAFALRTHTRERCFAVFPRAHCLGNVFDLKTNRWDSLCKWSQLPQLGMIRSIKGIQANPATWQMCHSLVYMPQRVVVR